MSWAVAERLAGWALVAGGVLAVADGAVTLAWQEPLSAVRQAGTQLRLEEQLAALERRHATQLPPLTAEPERDALRRQADRYAAGLRSGAPVGRLQIPRLGLDDVVVHGTDEAQLRAGPAHYPRTALPGQGATVAIAAHRSTYGAPLRDADRLRRGDLVVVGMPYGTYRYRVLATRVVAPGAVDVLRSRPGRDRLVLTTCHPRTSSAQRLVVTARRERGLTPGRRLAPGLQQRQA